MLISKEVEIELSGKNIKWFEDKGYEIPRRIDKKGRINVKKGTKIIVKVEDLADNSMVLVDVQCDDSGKILKDITWNSYLRNINKHNGKYIFNESKKRKRIYYGRGLSFYDWCYENLPKEEADKIMLRWDYDKNIDNNGIVLSPKDVGHGSDGFSRKERGYWFKCLDYPEHKSERKSISRFTHDFKGFMGSIECIQCNVIALTHSNLIKYFVNKEDASKYSFGSNESIIMKCPDCGFEKIMKISELTNKGFSCKKCGDGISYGEKFMFNVLVQLINNNFKVQLSKTMFKWCGKYKYDFYINKINGIIEIMGEQHYREVNYWRLSLKETINNDKKKRITCKRK